MLEPTLVESRKHHDQILFNTLHYDIQLFRIGLRRDIESNSDAEIIGVLNIANKAEIKAAEEAKSRASDAEIKQFAQQMITEKIKPIFSMTMAHTW